MEEESSILEAEGPDIKPLARTQTRTFPRSELEKQNEPVVVKIPCARLQDELKFNSDEGEERDVLRHLQPVSNTFKGVDPVSRRRLEETYTTHVRVKALQLQLKSMQRTKIDSSALEESKLFVNLWSTRLLPELERILDEKTEGGYTISVARGSKPGLRIIVIMTTVQMSQSVEEQLNQSKTDCLPSDIDLKTSVMVREAEIEFLKADCTSSTSVSSQKDDPVGDPINVHRYPEPVMGDSVGWENECATLGPSLQINNQLYRLVNWHLFDDDGSHAESTRLWNKAHPPTGLRVFHPSTLDQQTGQDYLGDVIAYSGVMYDTSRLSTLDFSRPPDQTVTDWALVDSSTTNIFSAWLNKVRICPEPLRDEIPIDTVRDPNDFLESCYNSFNQRLVYSSGRTAGYTVSLLTEVPMLYSLPNGTKTMNWALERSDAHSHTTEEWISSGSGVPGDSGAGVFCSYSNALLGQVWGRNTYRVGNPNPRLVFFTSMSDIFADIRERMPCKMYNSQRNNRFGEEIASCELLSRLALIPTCQTLPMKTMSEAMEMRNKAIVPYASITQGQRHLYGTLATLYILFSHGPRVASLWSDGLAQLCTPQLSDGLAGLNGLLL